MAFEDLDVTNNILEQTVGNDPHFLAFKLREFGVAATLIEATGVEHNNLFMIGLPATDAAFNSKFTESNRSTLWSIYETMSESMTDGLRHYMGDPQLANAPMRAQNAKWRSLLERGGKESRSDHENRIIGAVTRALHQLRLIYTAKSDDRLANIEPSDHTAIFADQPLQTLTCQDVAVRLAMLGRSDLGKPMLDARFTNLVSLVQLSLIENLLPPLDVMHLMGGAKTASARNIFREFGDDFLSDDLLAKQALITALHERFAYFKEKEMHAKTRKVLNTLALGTGEHANYTEKLLTTLADYYEGLGYELPPLLRTANEDQVAPVETPVIIAAPRSEAKPDRAEILNTWQKDAATLAANADKLAEAWRISRDERKPLTVLGGFLVTGTVNAAKQPLLGGIDKERARGITDILYLLNQTAEQQSVRAAQALMRQAVATQQSLAAEFERLRKTATQTRIRSPLPVVPDLKKLFDHLQTHWDGHQKLIAHAWGKDGAAVGRRLHEVIANYEEVPEDAVLMGMVLGCCPQRSLVELQLFRARSPETRPT